MSEIKPTQKSGIPPLRMPEGTPTKYSNMARISHTPSEIIFDFATMLPAVHPEVVARIVMSPMGAKMFMQALIDNITRYETNFGLIKLPIGASDLASSLFRNVQPPDKPVQPDNPEDEPKPEPDQPDGNA
jgi:hypothetical protein